MYSVKVRDNWFAIWSLNRATVIGILPNEELPEGAGQLSVVPKKI
jgi:hypothetical protein